MTNGLLIYGEIVVHFLFSYIWVKFDFLFYQCNYLFQTRMRTHEHYVLVNSKYKRHVRKLIKKLAWWAYIWNSRYYKLHSWRHQRSGAGCRRHGSPAIGGTSPSSCNPLVVISGPLPEEEPTDQAAPSPTSTEEAKLKTVIDEQIRLAVVNGQEAAKRLSIANEQLQVRRQQGEKMFDKRCLQQVEG